MAYKDKDRQREAQREWVRQKRAEQKGSTTIIDACGTEHKIDYEDRRRDWDRRGWLAKQYSIINGLTDKDGKLTDAGRLYLGQDVRACPVTA